MMKIICSAIEYTVEEKDSYYLVYNRLYSANLFALLLAALLEMFMPDPSTYKIPKCVLIPKEHNDNTKVVEIDKRLNVFGTNQYEYVLIRKQYNNWKLSYFLTTVITILMSIALIAFVAYIGYGNGFNLFLIIPMVVIAIFCAIVIRKLYMEVRTAKGLRKIAN